MKKLVSLLLCVFLLTGCTQTVGNKPDDGRLHIVTTVFPAYDFARAVAGDLAEVTLLLPPGTESHSYEPTPANILDVQGCDLFIYLGGESDSWVETILTAVEPQGTVMRMVDCVPLLEETHVEGMQMDPGHSHDHGADCGAPHHDHPEEEEEQLHEELPHEGEDHKLGAVTGMDEHVWTSPRNAADITLEIGEHLAELDSENAAMYQACAEDYAGKIRALDAEFEAFFSNLDEIVFRCFTLRMPIIWIIMRPFPAAERRQSLLRRPLRF